jgi:hypothetical protein
MPSRPEPDAAPRFLLDFLVSHHPALFALDELVREFTGKTEPATARVVIEEGVAELIGSGLAHRLDGFVFASRAAVRGYELASGG